MRIQNTTEEAMRFPIFPSCALWPGPKTAQNLEGGPGAGKGFLTLWEDGGKSSVLFPFPIFSSPSRPYRHLTFERKEPFSLIGEAVIWGRWNQSLLPFLSASPPPPGLGGRHHGGKGTESAVTDTQVSGQRTQRFLDTREAQMGKHWADPKREETPHCCAILMHHRKSRGNWVQGTQQLGTTLLSIKLKLF